MSHRVLVVEDNPISAKLTHAALEAAGYAVSIASDGATALRMARSSIPDFILQDLALPDIDGLELARQLKAIPGTQSIPLVAFTGFLSRVDEAALWAAGFDDLLSKPAAAEVLVQTVRSYLNPVVAPP